MQLPFGDLMLGAGLRKGGLLDIIGDDKQAAVPSIEPLESVKAEEPSSEVQNKDQQNGDANCEGPPRKRVCTGPTSDAGNYMMKQVLNQLTLLDNDDDDDIAFNLFEELNSCVVFWGYLHLIILLVMI